MATEHLIFRENAVRQYNAGRHLLTITYPLVKDPKLLIGVINNILSSFKYAMDAILTYEWQLRLVPNYPDNFRSKFNLFRYKSVARNKIPTDYITLMMDLRELLELHKQCPVAFQRGNRFVMATKEYSLKVLSLNDLKEYTIKNKEFLQIMDRIIKVDRK